MKIEIEKGVKQPPPRNKAKYLREQISNMQVGDSFVWYRSNYATVRNAFIKLGLDYSSTNIGAGKIRVWLIERDKT